MKVQKLYRSQLITAPIGEVWDFFSHAGNLAQLTPAYMDIRITSVNCQNMCTPGR